MPDEIACALTPEQWDARFAQMPPDAENELFVEVVASEALAGREGERILFVGPEWPTDGAIISNDDTKHAVLAIANDALPDGDRRKITRDDVAACRAMDYFAIQALAAKLAALLPPRDLSHA